MKPTELSHIPTFERQNTPPDWLLIFFKDNRRMFSHKTGIVAKQYTQKGAATLLEAAYNRIRSTLENNNFPLLFPIKRVDNNLIFPFLDITNDYKIHMPQEFLQLFPSHFVPYVVFDRYIQRLEYKLPHGQNGFIYTDPFQDDHRGIADGLRRYKHRVTY